MRFRRGKPALRRALDVLGSATVAPMPAVPRPPLLWGAYAALWLCVGLLLGVSELQHYLAQGGRHPWEPLLWELSSVVCLAAMGPGVYRWHVAGLSASSRGRQWLRHAAGAAVYMLLHVAGMFTIRFMVYGLVGVPYQPGDAGQILAYEAGKDLVSYTATVAVCHGLWLYLEGQRRQQELARLRAELAETRLSRLAEQIQPHFLFNTLNLISSVMYEDVARADRILCALADLLRQALTAQQAGSHTVAQELALVEPYLAIMQARFGERLEVRVEVSDEARACQLPALLLIAPVENAIKHDVAQCSGPVEVSVSGRVEAGRLLLTVSNSGMAPARQEREGAVGLANTRERLFTRYGAAAELVLQPGAQGGSVLRMALPA